MSLKHINACGYSFNILLWLIFPLCDEPIQEELYGSVYAAISYRVLDGIPVHLTLKIYDIRGRLVRTLMDEVHELGSYSVFWDSRDDTGDQASSGVYLYRLRAGAFVQTRKMVLLK